MGKKDDPTVSKPELVRPPNLGAWDKEGSPRTSNGNSSHVSPPPLRSALAEGVDYIDGSKKEIEENDTHESEMQIPGVVASPKKLIPEKLPSESQSRRSSTKSDEQDADADAIIDDSLEKPTKYQPKQDEDGNPRESRGESVKFNIPDEKDSKSSPISIPPISRSGSQGPSRPQSRSGHTTTISFKDEEGDKLESAEFPDGPKDNTVEIGGHMSTSHLTGVERGRGYADDEIYIPVSVARNKIQSVTEQFHMEKEQLLAEVGRIISITKESDQEAKAYFEAFIKKYASQLSQVKEVYKKEFASFKEEKEYMRREIENLTQEKMSLLEEFNKSMEATKNSIVASESKTQEKASDLQRQSEAVMRITKEKSAGQISELSNQLMVLESKLAEANAKLMQYEDKGKGNSSRSSPQPTQPTQPIDSTEDEVPAESSKLGEPVETRAPIQSNQSVPKEEPIESEETTEKRPPEQPIQETTTDQTEHPIESKTPKPNELAKSESSAKVNAVHLVPAGNVTGADDSQSRMLYEKKLSEKDQEIENLTQGMDKLKRELSMEKQTIASLLNKVETQNQTSQESNALNDQIREEIESKRSEVEQMKGEKDALSKQVENLNNKVQITNNFLQIGEPLPCMGNFITTVSTETSDPNERIKQLQQIKQKINIQQNLCKSKIESMASQVKSEQDRDLTEEEKESLRPLYEKYLISNSMVKCIGELTANLSRKNDEPQSDQQPQEAPTRAQIQELESMIKANESESIEKEKAIDSLKTSLESMKEENRKLEHELEKTKSEYQSKMAQLIADRSSPEPEPVLQQNNDEVVASLKQEIENLRQKLGSTESENASSKSKNASFKALPISSEAPESTAPKSATQSAPQGPPTSVGIENADLKALISDLEKQVAQLTKENNSLKAQPSVSSSVPLTSTNATSADDAVPVPIASSADTKPQSNSVDASNEQRQEVERLKQEVERLKRELQQAQESKPDRPGSQTPSTNTDLESSLAKANAQIQELTKQLTALQSQADKKNPGQVIRQGSGALGDESQSLREQIRLLDEKLKIETTKSSELNKMLTMLQSQPSDSMKELPTTIVKSTSQNQISELENLKTLQKNTAQELSRLEVLHQAESQQIVELKAQLLELQQQTGNYQQTIDQQKATIAELEKAQKEVSERMSSSGGNGEQVKELMELQSTLQSLKKENALLKEGNEKNASRLEKTDTLESKLKDVQSLLDQKNTEVSLLEDKVKSAETTESMLRSEIENHKLAIKNSELQEETLRMQIKKLENATLEGLSGDAESKALVSQLENLRQESEVARSQSKHLQTELDTVKSDLLKQQQESEKLLSQFHNSQAENQTLQTSLKAAQGLNEENNRKLVATQREKEQANEKVALVEKAQKALESQVELVSLQQNCYKLGLDTTSEEISSLLSRFRSVRIEPQFMLVQLQNLGGLLSGIKSELNSFVGTVSSADLDSKSVFRQSIALQQRLLVLDQELDFTQTQFLSIELKKEDVQALVKAFTSGLGDSEGKILAFIGDLYDFRSASIGSSEKQPPVSKGALSSQVLSKSAVFQVNEKHVSVDPSALASASAPILQKSKAAISLIDALLASVSKLEKDLSAASLDSLSSKSQSNALNQQLQYLQSQVQQLQSEKDEAKTEVRKLQTESETFQKEAKQVKTELENTTQKLSTEVLEKTNLAAQLKAAKAEVDALNEKITGIQAQLRSAETTAQTLENKLKLSQSETVSLQTQLQSSHSQSDSLQAQLKNSQAEVAKLQTTISDVQSKMSASEGQSEEFQKMVEERKKEIADLKAKFKKLLEASKALEADKNKVIASQNEKMAALNTQLQESKDANTALTNANKQLDETIAGLKNQMVQDGAQKEQEKQTLITSHQAEIDALTSKSTSEKEELNKKIKTLEDTSRKLKDAGKQLKGMVDQAKEKITNLEGQVKTLEETKSSLEQQLAAANTNITELNATLSAAQKEGGEYKAKSEKLMEAATKLKEKLKQTTEKLKETEAKVVEQDATIQAQLKKIQEDAILLKELKEAKERCAKAEKEAEELKAKFKDEQLIRKKIHNELEDVKGKIRVYCRIRPMSDREKERGCAQAVIPVDEFTVSVMKEGKGRNFTYDSIFSPWGEGSQDGIFEACKGLVQSAIDGYNVCIFAYGQTGSGKTFTMYGPTENPTLRGLAPRSMQEIFDLRAKNSRLYSIEVSCYMLELYRNALVDLFVDPRVDKKDRPKLDIKKDPRGNVYVNGAIIKKAESMQELMSFLEKGNQSRHVASTSMNAESSRSHLIFSIILEVEMKETKKSFVGKLSLVDLAGSERVSKSEATAERLKEAQDINSSLSALGNVIAALSSGNGHIPYRDNKLTELMSDSLGGNAKTLMFVNVSPADYNADETIQSLSYASRVKLIKNDVSKGMETKEIKKFKDRLKQYEDIISQIKAGEKVDITEIEKQRDFGPMPTAADREKWKEVMDQEYNDESAKPR